MKNNLLNYLTLIIALVFSPLLILWYFSTGPELTIYTYLGILLMIPSLVLFTIARIQLGSSFQISAAANKLVTGGLYKKLRHPIYYFGLAFLVGVIVFIHNFYLLILWCGLILLQRKRIRNEERVLEEKFGDEYVKYKKGTWF
ncbi:MAG: isoprenylcysteine carboxylmethyltransferase family protein [Bacteroidota bacterium]